MSWNNDAVCAAYRQFEDAFRRAFMTPYWDMLPTLARATVIAELLDRPTRPEVRELASEMLDGVFLHTAEVVGEPKARDRVVLGSSHAMVFLDTHRMRGATDEEVTP